MSIKSALFIVIYCWNKFFSLAVCFAFQKLQKIYASSNVTVLSYFVYILISKTLFKTEKNLSSQLAEVFLLPNFHHWLFYIKAAAFHLITLNIVVFTAHNAIAKDFREFALAVFIDMTIEYVFCTGIWVVINCQIHLAF